APLEVDELLAMLLRFAAHGNTAIIITHKLREALSVADDITVLRHGRTVLSVPAADTDAEKLATAMLGTSGLTPARWESSAHTDVGGARSGTSEGDRSVLHARATDHAG